VQKSKIGFERNQTTTMSASASRTYETQNDQQLDELHSKLRTLRSVSLLLASSTALPDAPFIQVTIDIHDDTQSQNLDLDNTVCFCMSPLYSLLTLTLLAGFIHVLRFWVGANNKERRKSLQCWWRVPNTDDILRCCSYLCIVVWVEDYAHLSRLVVRVTGAYKLEEYVYCRT